MALSKTKDNNKVNKNLAYLFRNITLLALIIKYFTIKKYQGYLLFSF